MLVTKAAVAAAAFVVIAVENRQLELNFPTEEAKEPTDE